MCESEPPQRNECLASEAAPRKDPNSGPTKTTLVTENKKLRAALCLLRQLPSARAALSLK